MAFGISVARSVSGAFSGSSTAGRESPEQGLVPQRRLSRPIIRDIGADGPAERGHPARPRSEDGGEAGPRVPCVHTKRRAWTKLLLDTPGHDAALSIRCLGRVTCFAGDVRCLSRFDAHPIRRNHNSSGAFDRQSRTIDSSASKRAFHASQSLFTLRQTRLTVSLPTAPPNRAASARRTRRVLVPAR
jgi:hypothetical protein